MVGADDPGRDSTLVALDNVCGYSAVFLRGTSPSFILKESSSAPRVIGLHGKAVKGLTRFHTSACQRGFAYIDAQVRTLINSVIAVLMVPGHASNLSIALANTLWTSGLGNTQDAYGF